LSISKMTGEFTIFYSYCISSKHCFLSRAGIIVLHATEATSLGWEISVFGKSQCSATAC
jgi:hypothetical protein